MHGKSDFLHGILLFHHGKSDFLRSILLFHHRKSDFLRSISLFPRRKSDFLHSISPFHRGKSDFVRGGVKFLRALRVANSRQLPEWTKVLQRDGEFHGRLQKLPTSYVQLTNPAFPKLWSNETPSRRRSMTIRIRCSSKQPRETPQR